MDGQTEVIVFASPGSGFSNEIYSFHTVGITKTEGFFIVNSLCNDQIIVVYSHGSKHIECCQRRCCGADKR